MLLPRLATVQERLPGVSLRLLNLPTVEIASGLADGTLDFGLLRADSVAKPVCQTVLGRLEFALFVPARLLPARRSHVLSAKEVHQLPMVTLEGEGAFRRELDRLARRAKAAFNVRLEVASFPLAARAVRSGAFAAVLPGVAREEFRGLEVQETSPIWLRPLSRPVALAWHPRLARVRPGLAKAIPALTELGRIEAA